MSLSIAMSICTHVLDEFKKKEAAKFSLFPKE